MKNVLIIGGAGYIGSHVCKELRKNGYRVVVYDNLSTGHLDLIKDEHIIADISHRETLKTVLYDFKIEAVLHFAAQISIPESIKKPFYYYHKNLVDTLNLLEDLQEMGICKFVFSSTAAVYGNEYPFEHTTPIPLNPYGKSKFFVEEILKDTMLDSISLRYFNVAGADPELEIGSMKKDASHLIQVCCETALGKRDKIQVFGNDYDTKDGTGVRDYIHVTDLASAHVDALKYLEKNEGNHVFNVGYNTGYSVKEVIETTEKVTGIELNVEYKPRREGDLASVIAENLRIEKQLKWKPKYNSLEKIVKTHYEWLKKIENRLY